MNKQIKWLTKTALLLALALLFQSLRTIIPKIMIPGLGEFDQLIIGSLVNTVLIVATLTVSISSGVTIAILTPLVAFMQGELAFPIMLPFVAIGNMTIVIIVGLLFNRSKVVALISGSIGKFITLFLTINYIAAPIIMSGLPADKGLAIKTMLGFKFGYPQLFTALVGSFIAYLIVPTLKDKFN